MDKGKLKAAYADWQGSKKRVKRKQRKLNREARAERRAAQKSSGAPKNKSPSPFSAFYKSAEWKRLRYDVLAERGNRCECCGASPNDGRTTIVVDHIHPIRFNWELRLEKTNLQVLCNDCNVGKGARHSHDWRVDGARPVVWGESWDDLD